MTGTILNVIVDQLLENNVVLRTEGSNKCYIKDGVLLTKTQDILLKPISKVKSEKNSLDNPNIGVIDCETFKDVDDIHKVYSLGFKTNLETSPITYYVDRDNINTNKIVLNMIDEILRPKYANIHFYCHNLGGYDVTFIIKVLADFNESTLDLSDHYKYDALFRDNTVLQLTIYKTINNTKKKVVLNL